MAQQPKYLQVADILRKEIAEGVFHDGQTLMTEEELRYRFNVSWTGGGGAAPMCATGPGGGREPCMWAW